MSVAIVTGSGGLVGSAASRRLSDEGLHVKGIDNNLRQHLFGQGGSVAWNVQALENYDGYEHFHVDIRDKVSIDRIFERFGNAIKLVIHAAGQPSHDWSATDPLVDFDINARGTMVLLEAVRNYCSRATFVFVSTNKVYGDSVNDLDFKEYETRYDLPAGHSLYRGMDESASIDASLHSPFGVSKAAADLAVQEYGRYFGLNTATFRCGCLTGPSHSGVQLHGFLSYLMKCAVTGKSYTVFGHGGLQVRDNIHSDDLTEAFWQYYLDPEPGAVYNMGGGRESNVSMMEAIGLCQEIASRRLNWSYRDEARIGDHRWWISDTSRFKHRYPDWGITKTVPEIMLAIHEEGKSRW